MNVFTSKRACLLGALCLHSVTAAEDNAIEEIVVIAHPLSGEGLSQAAVVLQGVLPDRGTAGRFRRRYHILGRISPEWFRPPCRRF